jgi:hypothetical protein
VAARAPQGTSGEFKDSARRGDGGRARSGPRPEEVLPGPAWLRSVQSHAGNHALAGLVRRWPEDAPSRNHTGLPDDLKAGIEALSGVSLDGVRVHLGSSRPAPVGALAYTQGHDIHVGPGQQHHLAHEAWHVVQQAQGRVRATQRLSDGRPVNDDGGLEREADVMGARAMRARRPPSPATAPPPGRTAGAPVLQMVKYIRKKNGQIVEVDDDYKKKQNEKWSDAKAFASQTSTRGGAAAAAKKEEVKKELAEAEARRKEAEAERAAAARKKERADRRKRVTPAHMPAAHQGKQISFPRVVGRADDREADLAYRGMSVNNIRNLQKGDAPVFTVQNPMGTASAIEHIVDDSETSPFLSFEAGGLGISAGKYAPKPVEPRTNKPLGVEERAGGFLKQAKSYKEASRREHAAAKRMGYIAGITATAGTERLDVSDTAKAERAFIPRRGVETERQRKAVDLAVADREVLVKPGRAGIAPAQVPFVAKMQEVDKAYYEKHLTRQTSSKRLGYFKGFDADPIYSKIQVRPQEEGNDQYKFEVPDDLRRADDDSESEMSDIDEMNFEDFDDVEDETEI